MTAATLRHDPVEAWRSGVDRYAISAPIETFTATTHDHHPTELARLDGARLVTASETSLLWEHRDDDPIDGMAHHDRCRVLGALKVLAGLTRVLGGPPRSSSPRSARPRPTLRHGGRRRRYCRSAHRNRAH